MRWWFVLCAVVGCWSEDLVDETFTREEWELLSTGFVLPEPKRCPDGLDAMKCGVAGELGHRLFFDTRLSGEIKLSDPKVPGRVGDVGKLKCADCHDAAEKDGKRPYMIDTRSSPNNVSSGTAKYTGHNALSVMNLAYKYAAVEQTCAESDTDPARCRLVFSWTGVYPTAGEVLILANGAGAMSSSATIRSNLICSDARYRDLYRAAFDALPTACATGIEPHDDGAVVFSLGRAFEAYLLPFTSVGSRFDRYVSGTEVDGRTSERDSLTEIERRGLRVFMREGMCIECHRGPMLSDLRFHNTGVKQEGQNVPLVDNGLGATLASAEDNGKFLTQSLRNIAETGPYMHAGQYTSLAEVIEFYRRGGDDPASFAGRKDPRMQPLEITDDQAAELEAFLHTLTGNEPDEALADALP